MRPVIQNIVEQLGRVVLGKEDQIRVALACLLAGGHLLIEDLPGIGKTTLARGLANVLGLAFRRVQFTSDLLPGDILGVSVFQRQSNEFVFHPGPIFTQVLLADEINRATPKTQSALLEAMEEHQVTVEGATRKLPSPFFVIATQNPLEQFGTYPLPESQLDRFLMRIHIGYPGREAEKRLLAVGDTKAELSTLEAALTPKHISALQQQVKGVHVSDALLGYVLDLVHFTRSSPEFAVGLSPRAGLGLVDAARAQAWLEGRDHVLPEDVQAVMPYVLRHRLRSGKDFKEFNAERLMNLLLTTPIP